MQIDRTGNGVVLVVDDEETVRSVTKRMLIKTGFTVIAACDGQEGLEKFKERADEITLVLLDMTMPRLNGEETFPESEHYFLQHYSKLS